MNYQPGDPIGNWIVLGKLGEGAMGIVYDVEHRVTKKAAALKILKLGGKNADVMVSKLIEEAKLLARLKHDNLVDVYDAGDGSDEHGYWLAMEKLTGCDLGELLTEEGTLSVERAVGFAEQIAAGAACAHSAGVVHRDLKPDNVHVSEKEAVTVIDFGAGQFTMGITLNIPLGTIPYMSPEQLRNSGDLDGRSDVYALGHILYTMLTGRHLYQQPDGRWLPRGQVFHNIMSADPLSSFENIDPPVRPLLVRALQKDREQRYPSMDAFAADLQALRRNIAPTYYPTQRFSATSLASVSASVSNVHFATDPMSTGAAAAVAKATVPATETQPRRKPIPGAMVVMMALVALVVGMGVVLMLTSPTHSTNQDEPAQASTAASADTTSTNPEQVFGAPTATASAYSPQEMTPTASSTATVEPAPAATPPVARPRALPRPTPIRRPVQRPSPSPLPPPPPSSTDW